MSSLMKKIEVAANVAIIAVAILLGATLVRSYLLSRVLLSRAQTQTTQPVAAIQPGTQLSLPDIDWQTNGRTLILALSTECHFCTESAPFYHRVAEERAKNGNLRLLA